MKKLVLNGKAKPQETAELEKALGMDEGKIKQMNFLDFKEVTLLDYEKEALNGTVKQAEDAKQRANIAQIKMQEAQQEMQSANVQVTTAQIAQNAILDLVRRRAGFPDKQNWYDPNKAALIIDPN